MVCDKTDNTVKVIKSDNRSSNYVPIKGGFPFRQIAQQWIDDNYTTTVCNPVEIVKQIQAKENNNPQTGITSQNNQPVQPAASTTPLQPGRSSVAQTPPYKNSSFIINAKFSDLGRVFSLESNLSPGFDVGFEQLFGKKYYLGIGVNMNFYFADLSTIGDYENTSFFFGKIPVFFGYRMYNKNMFMMYEAGVEINTEIQSTDDDFEFLGKIPNNNSYDITARMKVGKGKFMLTLGTELWVSEIFENDDYMMTVVYVGMKLSF
ncbi:MAG: hypothetical protein GQ525_16125 [Draconibacterium sp.]|nr:hypothetical protein [Draconibacterium sp.]